MMITFEIVRIGVASEFTHFFVDFQTPIATIAGHREAISGVQWIDEDTILTSSWDHTLRVWDLSLRGIKQEISGNKPFFDVSYSRLNSLVITSSADKNLRLYDLRTSGEYSRKAYEFRSDLLFPYPSQPAQL